MLRNKKGFEPATLLSLASVAELNEIKVHEDNVAIGANVTWAQVGAFVRQALPEFYSIIERFGSPQIRHAATLVGNVANGSPIADALPLLYVMDAEVELASPAGTRRVKINGFYKGYKVKDLAPDEIITRVLLPLPAAQEILKLYKISQRQDLDIATFGAAIRLRCAGNLISRALHCLFGSRGDGGASAGDRILPPGQAIRGVDLPGSGPPGTRRNPADLRCPGLARFSLAIGREHPATVLLRLPGTAPPPGWRLEITHGSGRSISAA